MKEEKIRSVIEDKIANIAFLCSRIGDDFDKDKLHDFRVNVKTLRSFLRLLRLHAPQPNLKLTRKFKKLYHISGAIRDAQLEYEKISGSAVVLPQYRNQLGRQIAAQKKEWKKYDHKKIVRKLSERLLALKFEKLHPAVFENFINAKMATIKLISNSESPTDDQVHRMRKEVKDILYTTKLASKKWTGAKDQAGKLPVQKLDDFAGVTGDYNDRRITLEHIRSFSPAKGSGEGNEIKKLTAKEKKSLGKQKNNILSLAHDLLAAMKQ